MFGKRVEVVQRRDGTFQVQMLILPGTDEMWESLTHAACFEERSAAEALAAKVRRAETFEPKYWLWSPSVCSPYAFMHEAPTAHLYPVCDWAVFS